MHTNSHVWVDLVSGQCRIHHKLEAPETSQAAHLRSMLAPQASEQHRARSYGSYQGTRGGEEGEGWREGGRGREREWEREREREFHEELCLPEQNIKYTFLCKYLQYAWSNVWLWFTLDHALQEGPYSARVPVHLVHVSCTAHKRAQFTSQSLQKENTICSRIHF